MTLLKCKSPLQGEKSSVIDFFLSSDTYDTMTLLSKAASELVK